MIPTSTDTLHNNDLVYRLPYQLTSRDTDMFSRLGIGFLVNLFVQSAMSANASIRFGFDDIRKQNLFWLFSRLTIEFNKTHLWRESGEVQTWLKTREKFIYLREFMVYNETGEIIAKATSNWVPVDLETKRPKIVEGLDDSFFLKDKIALNYSPEKLFPLKEAEEMFERKAQYFDMDLNKHVSSYRYTDWILDTFSADFHRKNYPQKLSINFLDESNAGETIQIVRNKAKETLFVFEAFNRDLNKFTFRAAVDF